jgi:hypothetical protein
VGESDRTTFRDDWRYDMSIKETLDRWLNIGHTDDQEFCGACNHCAIMHDYLPALIAAVREIEGLCDDVKNCYPSHRYDQPLLTVSEVTEILSRHIEGVER